ncbi:hypothetical protein ABU614_06985 [Lysobacter firmicutimachus]|uniref:DNA methylase N-4/N-6 domain-containing protein n=1 Tax=Lysobacter firmicutimachus TaxID=1792846 RepID=A0AAU8MW74_9GAMM
MPTPAVEQLGPSFRRVVTREILKDAGGSSFGEWTSGRQTDALSTNAGASALPFQRWHRFKEAFSPELIAQAVRNSPISVRRLADPFGGSGTSALAAQFLGVEPTTVEVNPFLADLISAKLASYRTSTLLTALNRVTRKARGSRYRGADMIRLLPITFVEPGFKDRWLFDMQVAIEIFRLRKAIQEEADVDVKRLFRVLLGGLIVELSNAVVSGKGRRYRKNWQERPVDPRCVIPTFSKAVGSAIVEITACSARPVQTSTVLHGDSRVLFSKIEPVDLIVCSPPYPNSFDYTDVYNMELWMLGYLTSAEANRLLRRSTLTSHVQVAREFAAPPKTRTLNKTMKQLNAIAGDLWDERLPLMVGGYFADLQTLLQASAKLLPRHGQAWFVVGDSQYANIQVPVAEVLSEIAPNVGFKVERITPFRSMRVSPQQSGRHMLSEDLVVFSRI